MGKETLPTIRILEDNSDEAMVLKNIVQKLGFEGSVTVVGNRPDIQKAIKEIQATSEPQIILCDGLHGYWETVYGQLKDVPGLNFALVSGSDPDLDKAKDKGIQSFYKIQLFDELVSTENPKQFVASLQEWMNSCVPSK